MNKKIFMTALLSGALLLGSLSVFASPNDATDADYYTPIQALTDCEDQTPAELPTEPSEDGNNFVNGVYLEEEDGNIYWYAGRYLDKTVSNAYNAGFYIPANTGMGNTGEYVIQTKLKFSQETAGGMMNLGFRINHGGASGKQMYFGINSLNTLDDNPENIHFKVEWYENRYHYNQSFDNLGTCVLKPNTWYLVRNVFNLDNKTAKFEIYNQNGSELIGSTGEFKLPETVSAQTDQSNSGGAASTFSIPYQLAFGAIRSDTNTKKGSGLGVDDFTIAKSTNKPVTVTCGQGGKVLYGGEEVTSGSVIPIPYNSGDKETFTIEAESGYEVQDIKVNGQSLGNTVTSVDFESVTSDQTLDVTFSKLPTAPSLSEDGPVYTYTNQYNGSQIAYFSINPGYGYTFTDGIAKIYEVGNVASEANPLKLENSSVISNASWDGKFGVCIFGPGLQESQQYVLAPYFVAENEDGEEVVIDPVEQGDVDQYTFTYGE